MADQVTPRRVVSAIALATIVTGTVGAHGATAPPANTGTSGVTLSLPSLTITDPTGATKTVSLGALKAAATTVDSALASVGVTGVDVLGAKTSDWSVDSNSGTPSGSHTVPLNGAVINGSVNVAGYHLTSTSSSATAALSALTGTLTAAPLGASLDLGDHGLTTNSTATSSLSELKLTAAGGSLNLGNLLPADVLDKLPLSELVSLAQSLGVPVPQNVTDTITKLTDLGALLNQLQTTVPQLKDAQQQLATLLASDPATTAAQQTLAAAQQTLTTNLQQLVAAQDKLATDTSALQSLQTQLANAQASAATLQQTVNQLTALVNSLLGDPLKLVQLTQAQSQLAAATSQLTAANSLVADLQQKVADATATVTADQQTVSNVQQLVNTAQGAVTTAQTTLDALIAAAGAAIQNAQQLVTTLTTTVTNLLTQVTNGVGALPDLHALVQSLLDLVTNVPLADLGKLSLDVKSVADATGGTGTVTCSLTGMTVAGQSLASGCDTARSAFGSAATALQNLLSKLPVASAPLPTISGLSASHHDSTATAGNPTTSADAGLTALHIAVPSMSLQAVTDTVVTPLDTSLDQLQALLPSLGLPSVSSTLSGALGTLQVALGALPTGSALSTVRTLGLDLSLGGVTTTVLHNRALASNPNTPSNPSRPSNPSTPSNPSAPSAPAVPSNPGAVTPSTPGTTTTQTPSSSRLPFTGGNAAAEIALGAVVLLAGAHLTSLGRRRAAKPTAY